MMLIYKLYVQYLLQLLLFKNSGTSFKSNFCEMIYVTQLLTAFNLKKSYIIKTLRIKNTKEVIYIRS